METIFIVAVTYFNKNHEIECTDEVNRIFINEDDAKGYCKLMNEGRNRKWLYTYQEYEICTRDFKRYA